MALFSGALTPQEVLRQFNTGVPLLYVRNTNDSGEGSLRWAIEEANALAGADTIRFDIGGGGPQTIQLSSPLPTGRTYWRGSTVWV